MPHIMNPYSFKRFLEHPERPRHPVQLVCTGANSILVHGELPDCVQNPSTHVIPPVVPDLNRTTSQSLSSHATVTPAVTLPSNSRSMPEVSSSSYSDYTSNFPTPTTPFPLSVPLPDIHPSTSCEDNQVTSQSRCPESINLDLLPCGLPDFITHSNCYENTPLADRRNSVSSSNVFACKQVPRRSISCSGLFTVSNHTGASTLLSYPIRSHSYLFPSCVDLQQGTKKSLTPFHPVSSVVCSNSPDVHSTGYSSSVPLWQHQQEIAALRNRQSELEDQLKRTKALLRDRESRLESVGAEFEVVETRSTLRIKALEHELAKERHRSAQDRWRLVQLRRRLAVQESGSLASLDYPGRPSNGLPFFPADIPLESFSAVNRTDGAIGLQNGTFLSPAHNSTFGLIPNLDSDIGLPCGALSSDRNSLDPSGDSLVS